MSSRLQVTREIAASPEAVFDAITDISRIGEWSPECVSCEWIDGATGPALGAMFDGHNRSADGTKEWTTQARITTFDRPTAYVFDCLSRDFHFATWGYEIEPTEEGCRVTEFTEDLRPEAAKERGPAISGVADREAFNLDSMTQTLDRVAAALE